MKSNFTKNVYLTIFTALLAVLSFSVNAQTYTAGTLQSGKLASAVAVDASGNVFVVQINSTSGTIRGGATGEVVEYTAGNLSGAPTVIATGIPDDDNSNNYATGIVVDPTNGDIFVLSDNQDFNNTAPFGIIYKLTKATGYTKSAWITGNASVGYPSAIAIDASGNLYVDEYNGTNNYYQIDKYPRGSTSATTLYTGLDASQLNTSQTTGYFYTAPTGLAVNSTGSVIYVTEDFDDDGLNNDQGHIDKLTQISGNTYSKSVVSSGFSATGLALDASGNLFALQATTANTSTGSNTTSNYNANYGLYEYPSGNATQSPTTIFTPLHASGSDLFPYGIAIISDGDIFVTDGQTSTGANAVYQLLAPPTTQASNVSFSSTTTTGTTINWTNGNGSSRAVFMAAASSGVPAPANATAYTASSTFRSGTQIGATGWYCVYNGTGSTVSVSGLSASTTYRVMVVEYNNGSLSDQNYLTSTVATNPNNVTTPTPTIIAPGTPGTPTAMSTITGTASASSSFTASGSNLSANVTATAPSGFDISLNNSTWSASGGAVTLTESGGTLSSTTVYVRLDAADAVNTYSGNVVLASTGATSVNVAIPTSTVTANVTVSSLSAVNAVLTNAASVQYTLTFSAAVTGLTASNFAVNTTGSVSGASVTSVTGSGTTYTITVNTGAGDGTIQLALNNATGLSPSISTTLPFNGATYTIDKTPPTATVTMSNYDLTVGQTATITVTFSKKVNGVTLAGLTAQSGALSSLSTADNQTYTLTFTPTANTYAATNVVTLGTTGITDLAGNAMAAAVSSNNYIVNTIVTIVVSPSTLPAATVGSAYSKSLSASGGTSPYTYAVTTGALPAGLSLSSGGALTGTPTAGGSFNFTITATDAGSYTGSQAYTLTVNAPAIVLSPASLPAGTVGISYSQSVTASGGTSTYTYAVTAGALPSGLTLSSSGTLSGTPSAGGNFSFTITGTDSSTGTGPYTGSQAYTLTVNAPTITLSPGTLPNAAIGASYSQSVTASGGTSAYTYAVTAGALPAGLSLSSSGTLSGTPTAGGSFSFTITGTDSSTGNGPYTGSQAYTLTVNTPTITLSPNTLPNAAIGASYSQSVTASGGTSTYTYAVTAGALPAGLTLSSSGTLSGTPTAGGNFSFTITGTDSSTGSGPYTGSQAYTLTVNAPTITLSPSTLPNAAVGVSYSHALTASGGTSPYTYSVTAGALPSGLTFSSSTGVISGTPTAAGVSNFTITATDASTGTGAPFSASQNYSITTTIVTPIITFNALPSKTYGDADVAPGATSTNTVTPITYTSSNTAVATIVSGNIHIVGAGSTTITASQAAGNNYGAATNVTQTLTVGKVTLTVTPAPSAMTYGGIVPTLTVTYSGFVNADGPSVVTTSPTVSTTGTSASPVGTYPITASSGAAANYALVYNTGTLTITPAQLDVTASNETMVYGGSFPTFGVTYSGFVNGDNATSLTVQPAIGIGATPSSPVGTYALTPQGAIDPNYIFVYHTGTLTITPAALTITAGNATMTYGGSIPALSATYGGFVNGDNAGSLTTAPTLTTTATSASPVGTYHITASGAVDPNYTITYVDGTMTVGKAALTVTADNKTMPLGGPLPTLTISYSGFVNGDGASNLTTVPTPATTATAGSPAGSYTISVSGGSSSNYTFSYVNGTLTVQKAILTITANAAASVYGSSLVPNGSLSVSYSGFINGDGPGSLTVPPTVTNTAFAGGPVGSYALIPSGAVDPNYTIVYVNGIYSITPASLNITAVGVNKTYGAAMPALSATYIGFVNGDNASSLTVGPVLVTPAIASSPAGTYPITPSGAVDPNYNITYTNGTMTIGPAPLTVTAASQSMTYGDNVPMLSASYTGFVNGDNTASLTTQPTISTTATSSSPVGTYPITASGAADPNYTISYVGGTLTVNQATPTITFAALPTKTYGDADFDPGAASINTATPVTYVSSNSAVATIVSGKIHIVGAGSSTITASQAADANDNAAADKQQTLTVNPAALTITTDNQTRVYGATNPVLTISYSGFVNGDTQSSLTAQPVVNTAATTSSPAGNYPITASGAASPNYTIKYINGSLTVGQAALTITADNQTKVYGAANPALTVSYSGFVNGDNAGSLATPPIVSTTTTAASPTGSYPITARGAVDNNYAISYVNGSLTVGQATLTISADNQSKVYGAANPAFTVSYSGFVNGDNAASLTTQPAVSTAATPASPIGSYPIIVAGAVDNNYAISYVNGSLTVGQATLTIVADNQTKVYGAANPALTVSYSGFVNGDSQSSFTTQPAIATTATASSSVATYPITASGAAIPNYSIVYKSGNLTVTPAVLTVTADNKSRNYGVTNPPLTVTYSGFVNNDDINSLSTPATATTKATSGSAPGNYPIVPGNAASSNYSFNYVNGTLTIIPLTNADLADLTLNPGSLSPAFSKGVNAYAVTVENTVQGIQFNATFDPTATAAIDGTQIPNGSLSSPIPLNVGNNTITLIVTAQDGVTTKTYTVVVYRGEPQADITATNILTPNGDGINDYWEVKDILLYPDNTVTVYDRAGRVVYSKHGYQNDWDGSVNGSPLQEGTYFYAVNLGDGGRIFRGYISIIRSR